MYSLFYKKLFFQNKHLEEKKKKNQIKISNHK